LGDIEVYKYLNHEQIPLLMEIPFNREIASAYSKGELITKTKPKLQAELYSIFNKIRKQYGNSSN
jgi:MinD superfamily P-loop ATPase